MDKSSADLILFNANVLTMERTNPIADAVVIGGGRIIAVGGGSQFECRVPSAEYRGGGQSRYPVPGTRYPVIDCRGKTIVPGFHDAHVHVFALISSLLSLDCSPSAVSSIVDIRRLIARRAEQIPEGNWIKGAEYNEFYLVEKRHPTRWDLDRAAPCHPVKLAHRTRQACVLNSRALSLAGINRETPDPSGGLIDRDYETGEPTGLLFGMNTYLSEKVIPLLPAEELGEGLRQADQLLLSWGITSLQDATAHNGLDQWEHFQRIKDEGKLQPRVTMMFGFDALDQFQRLGLRPGSGDENLSLGMVKIRIDETRGSLNPPQEALNKMVLSAHRGGFQVAIHAIEENTVEAALNALEHVLHRLPKAGHRHRIEHCSECPPRLLRRLKETQAMVVTQPAFLYYSGERYLSEVATGKLPWLYRLGSFWDNGITVAASSDGPVIPLNPLIGIYAAVARRAESGQLLSPQEVVSSRQALWMYTMGGAYASFTEDVKGSIAVGKFADLVVLSADPTRVTAEEIKEISVEKTIIRGKVVWESPVLLPSRMRR